MKGTSATEGILPCLTNVWSEEPLFLKYCWIFSKCKSTQPWQNPCLLHCSHFQTEVERQASPANENWWVLIGWPGRGLWRHALWLAIETFASATSGQMAVCIVSLSLQMAKSDYRFECELRELARIFFSGHLLIPNLRKLIHASNEALLYFSLIRADGNPERY